jgi:hypothetical protein
LCEFLISPKGFIPSVLRSNIIFLGSLEKSSWLRLKCFHCLPSAWCWIFPSLFCWTCQSWSCASIALENIRFKWSMTGRYHITRAETFLSLAPWLSWSGGAVSSLARCYCDRTHLSVTQRIVWSNKSKLIVENRKIKCFA